METLSEISTDSLFFGNNTFYNSSSLNTPFYETDFQNFQVSTSNKIDESDVLLENLDNCDINLDILLNQDINDDSHIIDMEDSSLTPDSNSNEEYFQENDKQYIFSKVFSSARNNSKSLLPFTINDIPKTKKTCSSNSNLNNEDLVAGQAGERIRLSEEEKSLLFKEGYRIPTHFPLTKSEERALKNIRRKIRNKISAKNSRAKKATYVEGLEKRINQCTKENNMLRKKLIESERDRFTLHKQVMNLQKQLSKFLSHNSVSTTSLMLLFITFIFLFTPAFDPRKLMNFDQPNKEIMPGRTRFLFQESDIAQEIGEPYLVTVRNNGVPWKEPPQSPLLDLKPVNHSNNKEVNITIVHEQQSSKDL